MTHRFPIKEIAAQSGLSTATVDRVLNRRAHVSAQSAARVSAAIAELEGQEAQLAARGRRVFVDLVVEAPRRFSTEIRAATEAILPLMGGAAVIRPRFSFHERLSGPDTAAILDRIARRGSQGICLKARDLPDVRAAVARVVARGIPVVTIFTDLTGTERIAYAGLDNAMAGRTAAWLIAGMTGGARGTVLTAMSDARFAGEEQRFAAFARALGQEAPHLAILDASGGGGLNPDTARRIAEVAGQCDDLRAVYSMGGGNRGIRSTLDKLGRTPRIYVAHDLDMDNRDLLRRGAISIVLDHDLRADMQAAFGHILRAHRLIPPSVQASVPSPIRVITPENIPP
jgi:LacI family transcriptional regulator